MVQCPKCARASQNTWKDGIRKTVLGDVQRYLCRACGYRFSKPIVKTDVSAKVVEGSESVDDLSHNVISNLNLSSEKSVDNFSFSGCEDVGAHGRNVAGQGLSRFRDCNSNYRVCASVKEAKNLSKLKPREVGLAGATADIKGKIVEYLWWMKKQGYSRATIRLHTSALRTLHNRGSNLVDPETVKEVIALQSWSDARKRNVINAYTTFLKHQGKSWEKPKCRVTQKIPFIPTEKELDSLIAGSGKKTSTFLQLLKETAMRAGEAKRLEWGDTDSERRIITLNRPEKGSKPRMWKVSKKLMGMLENLPKNSQRVFGNTTYDSMKQTLQLTRKRLSVKLQNPRLLKITFHTLRHWKATTLYHQTKDIYYVKEFLGHRSIKNTEIYITIERTIFSETSNDEFSCKVASKPEEIKNLLELGFEYICEREGLLFFRKRK